MPQTLVEQFTREFYSRGLAPMRYASDGDWITIGGNKGAPAGSKGGTPVKLGEGGKIIAGPSHLEGHSVGSLPTRRDAPQKQTKLLDVESKSWQPALFPGGGGSEPAKGRVKPKLKSPGGKYGPGVKQTDDGRHVGVTQLNINQISYDPARFQYKVSGVGDEGVTEELKEVKHFRPEFAGQLLVWHDPADGKAYVVNGHHRYELAKRTGYDGPISTFLVDAKDASEARALGALANVAEGRGTSVDAAKFFRETQMTPADVREKGISLKGRVADDGLVLSRLSDKLFPRLASGDMKEARAMAIATQLGDDPAMQDKLAVILEKREEKTGKPVADGTVEEMAREMADTPKVTEKKKDLFDEWEEEDSLFVDRNDLKGWLIGQLAEEARAFRAVSHGGREERLASAGNVLATEENKSRAKEASGQQFAFKQLVNSRGEISDAVNEFAAKIREQPKQRNALRKQLVERIRPQLQAAFGGAKESFARALQGNSGASGGQRDRYDRPAESLVERFSREFSRQGLRPTLRAMTSPTTKSSTSTPLDQSDSVGGFPIVRKNGRTGFFFTAEDDPAKVASALQELGARLKSSSPDASPSEDSESSEHAAESD